MKTDTIPCISINKHLGRKNVLWLDTETGGIYKRCDAHQIAGIIEQDGKVVETFVLYARPFYDSLITKEALRIMNVTYDTIWNYPKPSDTYVQLLDVLSKYCPTGADNEKFIIAGHVSSFDISKLLQFGQKVVSMIVHGDAPMSCLEKGNIQDYILSDRKFCSCVLARRLRKCGVLPKGRNRLVDLADEFKVSHTILHDAVEDIRVTREIAYQLLSEKALYEEKIKKKKKK